MDVKIRSAPIHQTHWIIGGAIWGGLLLLFSMLSRRVERFRGCAAHVPPAERPQRCEWAEFAGSAFSMLRCGAASTLGLGFTALASDASENLRVLVSWCSNATTINSGCGGINAVTRCCSGCCRRAQSAALVTVYSNLFMAFVLLSAHLHTSVCGSQRTGSDRMACGIHLEYIHGRLSVRSTTF